MSHQRCPTTTAIYYRAKPSAGNGKARPNGGRSARRDARDGPELAMRHNVSGVPQTTINDGKAHVVGAVPEPNLLAEIQRVLAG